MRTDRSERKGKGVSLSRELAEYEGNGAKFLHNLHLPVGDTYANADLVMLYHGQIFVFDFVDSDEEMPLVAINTNDACIRGLKRVVGNDHIFHSIVLYQDEVEIKNAKVYGTDTKAGHISDAVKLVKQCLAFNPVFTNVDDSVLFDKLKQYSFAEIKKKTVSLEDNETEMKKAGRKLIVVVVMFLVVFGVIPTISYGTRFLEKETEYSDTFRGMVALLQESENYVLGVVSDIETNNYVLPDDKIDEYQAQVSEYIDAFEKYEPLYDLYVQEGGRTDSDYDGVYKGGKYVVDTCQSLLESVRLKGDSKEILCRSIKAEMNSINDYLCDYPVFGVRYRIDKNAEQIEFYEYNPWYKKVFLQ